MASSSGPPPPATPQLTSNQPQPPGQGKANSQGRIQEGERGVVRGEIATYFFTAPFNIDCSLFLAFLFFTLKRCKGSARALLMRGE